MLNLINAPEERPSPILSGLKLFVPFDEGAGLVVRDTIQGRLGRAGSACTWRPNGMHVSSDTSGNAGVLFSNIPPMTKNWTYAFRADPPPSSLGGMISRQATANEVLIYFDFNSKMKVAVPAVLDVLVSVQSCDSKMHTWVCTRAGDTWSMYIDGRLDITASSATAQGSSPGIRIGRFDAGTGPGICTFQWAAAWDRALTASEAAAISHPLFSDRFQIREK